MRRRVLRNGVLTAILALTTVSGSAAHESQQASQGKGALAHWVFSEENLKGATIRDLAGAREATIEGPIAFHRQPDALLFDGKSTLVRLADGPTATPYPRGQLTAEAWVMLLSPREWGGIVGALQDNGGFEKGWLLGYRGHAFCFATSTEGADDGDGRLTYLTAPREQEPGVFHHVVGTYDGAEMRLYVDGRLLASSSEQSGKIIYPDAFFREIGAYHDKDELFRFHGAIAEVRLHDRALDEKEVRSRFSESSEMFPRPLLLAEGPFVRYAGAGKLSISWRLQAPGRARVEYGTDPGLVQTVRSTGAGVAHAVELPGISQESDYFFRILARNGDGNLRGTSIHSLDASSDLVEEVRHPPTSSAEDDALMAVAAQRIVDLTGVTQGYCLDIGCETGKLAQEIAARTRLQIIGIQQDPAKVAAARQLLDAAGLYGVRVSVQQVDPGTLPYTRRIANLIVSESALRSGRLPEIPIEDIARLLRPHGGVVCLGAPDTSVQGGGKLTRENLERWQGSGAGLEWNVSEERGVWAEGRRGPPQGGGEWSHLYAEPGNSASSGDLLQGPLRIQWFGRPGPRNMVDRHHRAMGPLFKNGRVFVLGNNRVLALDAYNGTLLWDVGVPGSRRVAAARDCGHFAAAEDAVYLAAENRCVELDAATGEPSRVFTTPPREDDTHPWWGYVATIGDHLFGSAQKKGASLTGHSRETLYRGPYYDARPIATSELFFCLHRKKGKGVWTYRQQGGSAIINSTIAIDGGRVSFVESRNPAALENEQGRVPLETLLAEGHAWLVTLEEKTGKRLWNRQMDLSAVRHVLSLASARGKLVLTGARNEAGHPRYDLHAFDARTGEPLWSQHYLRVDKGVDGDHGEQDQHPVLAGDTVYSRPFAFDLHTGKKLPFQLDRGGHGCGALSASAYYLYGRGGNPRRYPLGENGSVNEQLTRVTRPGCWINIIPSGGMIVIPEGSSGCTCDFPLQTSLGLIPEAP